MKKRVKLMIAALLGFSTACSTVKNNVKEQPAEEPSKHKTEAARNDNNQTVDQGEQIHIERIKLMYGTPSPRPRVDSVRRTEPAEKQ